MIQSSLEISSETTRMQSIKIKKREKSMNLFGFGQNHDSHAVHECLLTQCDEDESKTCSPLLRLECIERHIVATVSSQRNMAVS